MSNWKPPWVPVATPDGRPLSLAKQWSGTRWTQPLPGGLRLVAANAAWWPQVPLELGHPA